MLSVGPFQSQKKNLFHKIVSKYKHKKEKPNVPEKGIGAFHPPLRFLDHLHSRFLLERSFCAHLFLPFACFSAIGSRHGVFIFSRLRSYANLHHLDSCSSPFLVSLIIVPYESQNRCFSFMFGAFYTLVFWAS